MIIKVCYIVCVYTNSCHTNCCVTKMLVSVMSGRMGRAKKPQMFVCKWKCDNFGWPITNFVLFFWFWVGKSTAFYERFQGSVLYSQIHILHELLYAFWPTIGLCNTVKPVTRDHSTGPQNVVFYDRWSFIAGTGFTVMDLLCNFWT